MLRGWTHRKVDPQGWVGQVKPDLEQAWKLVESGTDDNCDSAARIALAIVDETAESASDRAEAMFILGQIARFLQPWRCPDDGIA